MKIHIIVACIHIEHAHSILDMFERVFCGDSSSEKCEHVEWMVLQDVCGRETDSGTSWQHSRSVFVLSKIRFLMLLSDNYAIHLTKSFHKNNFQAMLT